VAWLLYLYLITEVAEALGLSRAKVYELISSAALGTDRWDTPYQGRRPGGACSISGQ
jgi:hypothetical protein